MKIDVTSDMTIRLKEVFNSVLFETEEGEELVVCMRDGGFEIGVRGLSAKPSKERKAEKYYSWHRIMNGEITPMVCKNVDIGPCDGGGEGTCIEEIL